MGLYTQPGVYQASWIEMRSNVAMNYEVDHLNDTATLRFGARDEYALTIGRDNLDQMLELATAARRDLANPPAEDEQDGQVPGNLR